MTVNLGIAHTLDMVSSWSVPWALERPAHTARLFHPAHLHTCHLAGVQVNVVEHSLAHGTPDAVFPNNWFSTHSAHESLGATKEDTMVLYPMKCPNRAAERRPELVELIRERGYPRMVDLSGLEAVEDQVFEGTGVLVIDRVNGVAYVSISERADRAVAEQYAACLPVSSLSCVRWDMCLALQRMGTRQRPTLEGYRSGLAPPLPSGSCACSGASPALNPDNRTQTSCTPAPCMAHGNRSGMAAWVVPLG